MLRRGLGPALGTVVAAELVQEQEIAAPRQAGPGAAHRHRRQERPSGPVVFPDQVFQGQRQIVDPVRRRHLGEDRQLAVGHGAALPGQVREDAAQPIPPGAGQPRISPEAAKVTPASLILSRAAARDPSRSMARQASSTRTASKPSRRASSAE